MDEHRDESLSLDPVERAAILREAVRIMATHLQFAATIDSICARKDCGRFVNELRRAVRRIKILSPQAIELHAQLDTLRDTFEAEVFTIENCTRHGCLRVCGDGWADWQSATVKLLSASYDATGEERECLLEERALVVQILAMEQNDPTIHKRLPDDDTEAKRYWDLRQQLSLDSDPFDYGTLADWERGRAFNRKFALGLVV